MIYVTAHGFILFVKFFLDLASLIIHIRLFKQQNYIYSMMRRSYFAHDAFDWFNGKKARTNYILIYLI